MQAAKYAIAGTGKVILNERAPNTMVRVSIELVSLQEKAPWIAIHFGLDNQNLRKTGRNDLHRLSSLKCHAPMLTLDNKLVQCTPSVKNLTINQIARGYEGHHLGRRNRVAPLPRDDGCFEAASSRFRQADDLLSAVDADVCGHPGYSHHYDAPGSAPLRTFARRRKRPWTSLYLCVAGQTARPGRRLRSRRRLRRFGSRRPRARRQHLSRT